MQWYITRNWLAGKFGDRNGHRFAGIWPALVGWKSRGGGEFLVGVIPPSPAPGRAVGEVCSLLAFFAFQAGRLATKPAHFIDAALAANSAEIGI
jgi:hypothetical protein